MANVCLYFQLHQPYRLRQFSVFEMNGSSKNYFSDGENRNQMIFQKVAQKSYIPMLSLLLHLIQTVPDFAFTLSCSGIFLEQAEAFQPEIIGLIRELVASGRVEILAETYHHSLASLYSPKEFAQQVAQHTQKMKNLFGYTPRVFRNTELIYSNQIAELVSKLGFLGMLTEGVDRYLHGRSRSQLFISNTRPPLPLLLKNAQLSDDIAFRFSEKSWVEFPLTSEKYLAWLDAYMVGELVNLFMDFETFGEHQWADTGIFDFFAHVVRQIAEKPQHRFVRPSEVMQLENLIDQPIYDVPEPISWADIDRDLTAWRGNSLQHDTLRLIYSLEEKVLSSNDITLIEDWRKLQTSDHFYYMCVKWAADGDVHKYFSPYDSPFEAYNRFTTIVADLIGRLNSYV